VAACHSERIYWLLSLKDSARMTSASALMSKNVLAFRVRQDKVAAAIGVEEADV
jgi:hypothetical protein